LVNRIAQRPNISIYLLSGQQIFTTIRLSLLVNIVRTVARKPANHLKFCWLKVICCICQSNELEIKQRTVGGKTGVHGSPRFSLRTPTALSVGHVQTRVAESEVKYPAFPKLPTP